jgi:hypothetical protein
MTPCELKHVAIWNLALYIYIYSCDRLTFPLVYIKYAQQDGILQTKGRKGWYEANSIFDYPKILHTTVWNLFAWATWRPEFVHTGCRTNLQQQCTNPFNLVARATKFFYVARNIFIAIYILLPSRISSHATSSKCQTTVRFTVYSRTVCPLFETYLMPPPWPLEILGCSEVFGQFVQRCRQGSRNFKRQVTEILTAANIKTAILWGVTLCNMVDNDRRFGETSFSKFRSSTLQ